MAKYIEIEKVDINDLIAISSEGLQTGEIEPDVAGQICGKPPRLLEIIRKSLKEGKISERMAKRIFALFEEKEEEFKMTKKILIYLSQKIEEEVTESYVKNLSPVGEMVFDADKVSDFWNNKPFLFIPGVIWGIEGNKIIYEGMAGMGCRCDGCLQEDCDLPSCQFCECRTEGREEWLFVPKCAKVILY